MFRKISPDSSAMDNKINKPYTQTVKAFYKFSQKLSELESEIIVLYGAQAIQRPYDETRQNIDRMINSLCYLGDELNKLGEQK